MEQRRLIPLAAGLTICAVSAVEAETTVVRPNACQAQASYLLARNSAALIQIGPQGAGEPENHVIVFRYQPRTGWASQRLLKRFDLRLRDDGTRILNSGAFCSEER